MKVDIWTMKMEGWIMKGEKGFWWLTYRRTFGKSNYNVTGYQHRCQFVAGAAIKENQTAPPEASVDADLLEEMRNNRRAQDEKLARQNALDVINRNKARKQQVMSHVKPPERVFMQEQLTSASNPEKEKITGSKFPGKLNLTFLLI